MVLNRLLLLLFLFFLFFLTIDLTRLFGDSLNSLQTLIKGTITISIIGLYLINFVYTPYIKNYSYYPRSFKVFLLPWIYLFIAFLSLIWSSNIEETIKSFIGILSIILLIDLLTKTYELDYILKKSLLILDIIIILSILTYFLNMPFSVMHLVTTGDRYAGITYGAHAIARVSFIAILIRVYFLSKKPTSFLIKILNLSIFLLYIYSIHIADSRQILLTIIVIAPIWFISLKKHYLRQYQTHLNILSFLIGIMCILLYINYSNESILSSFQRAGTDDVWTFTGRIYVWESALKLINLKPLLGYGFGAGGSELFIGHQQVSDWTTNSAHNVFLHQLLDLGIVGLSLLVIMISYFIMQSIKLKNNLFISYSIFILIVGFFERALSGSPSLMYLFFILFFFYLRNIKFENYKNRSISIDIQSKSKINGINYNKKDNI